MAAESAATAAASEKFCAGTTPQHALSVWDGVMITVGIVIGAGIFRTPAEVAGIVGSPWLMMILWIAGGALSLAGALSYAELASTYPSAGGEYSFLTRAYGRHVGFLFAWARSTVIVTGSIALLAFIVGDYLTQIAPLGRYSSAIYASLAICTVTIVNLASLRSSARMQAVLTLAEIAGVLGVALAAFLLGPGEPVSMPVANASTDVGAGAVGLAMVFILLSYGGWNEAAYVSAEIRGGAPAIVRTLTTAIGIITVIYALFVASLWYGLGFAALSSSDAVGATVMQRALGQGGMQIVSIAVAVAALTSMNATMIAGARCNYAVAADWPALRFMRQWHTARSTPTTGFTVQAAIALLLVMFGAFETDGFRTMVEFTAPVFWFFFLLTGIALFILRRKDAHRPRPFAVPCYPLLPLVFIATCGYLLYSSVRYAQSQKAGWIALAVVLAGIVAWLSMLAAPKRK